MIGRLRQLSEPRLRQQARIEKSQTPVERDILVQWVRKRITSSSYTMICPSVQGDNPQALASEISPIQVDKPWYNYFIPPSSVQNLLSIKYFGPSFEISDKGGINIMMIQETSLTCSFG